MKRTVLTGFELNICFVALILPGCVTEYPLGFRAGREYYFLMPPPLRYAPNYGQPLTGPVQPVFLEPFAVVTVEHLVHGHDVGGMRAPGPLGLADWRAYDVGHLGEQIERVVGGVLDRSWVELLQRGVPHVHCHLPGVGRRRLVQHVVCDEREHGCATAHETQLYRVDGW